MYRAMLGIGLVCGFIIVSVFQLTLPAIKQNQLELLQKSLYQIFPDANRFARYQLQDDGRFVNAPDHSSDNIVYAMYNAHDDLLGIVVKAKGMGYQDLIEMLYGYKPDQQIIQGYQILDSRETPGLGNKIETDDNYRKNFDSLDVTVNSTGNELMHPIEIVKPGSKKNPWQIDTITGATISSRAVGNIVAKSAARWIPKIQQRIKDFTQ